MATLDETMQIKPKPVPKRFVKNQIPETILNDPSLNAAISLLPSNYNLEVHKCVWRIRSTGAKRLALQLPEGLLMYSLILSDIFIAFAGVTHCFILGDVTYGACCVDDLSALALGADLLIHYGHSCLVPIDATKVPCLYFASAIREAKPELEKLGLSVLIPQSKPLSAGEVLGCTAPRISSKSVIGSFSDMVLLFLEEYDHQGMKETRKRAIERAREAKSWGIVLGTLGRQGNPRILDRLEKKMREKHFSYTVVLMSEISPTRIALFEQSVDAWIQIACPRLSIDWGEAFEKPLLTPFEAEIAVGDLPGWWEKDKSVVANSGCCSGLGCGHSNGLCSGCGNEAAKDVKGVGDSLAGDYPMDYYAQGGGEWNSSYLKKATRPIRRNVVSYTSDGAAL
ncbi:hypothetical protein GH714_001547 [Hevea brasiliensis]|uniref:2-(3-amino-3-carboxypropyl)histidine synthase subunit 1 n=1 Tax=Hevea brasiliensis TaxID=3981 RepID=A0A6A6M6H9_HEVBR|nr:hypothetical protein GH714_001547 [Hevea brasiliensis]